MPRYTYILQIIIQSHGVLVDGIIYSVIINKILQLEFVYTYFSEFCLMGTDRHQTEGHKTLLLRQIARDLLHALSYRYDNTWHCLW